jgi:hypothetical protein
MGQRINIQYSIDVDDLEMEVSRLMDKANAELLKLTNFNSDDLLSLKSLESIDELRKGLASVDAALQDVSAIVGGYVAYKASEKMPQPQHVDIEEKQQESPVVNEKSPEVEYSF